MNKCVVVLLLLMLLVLIPNLVIGDSLQTKVCNEDGATINCGGDEGDCAVTCNGIQYNTGANKINTNDCWEVWTLYTATCPGSINIKYWPSLNWSNDESWGVDNCNLGTSSCGSFSYTCAGGDGYVYAYGFFGYCGAVDWSGGGNVVAESKVVDTGTAWPGLHETTSTFDVKVKTEETNTGDSEIYFKSVLEGYLSGTLFQPSGYLSAYQSIAYIKGITSYPDTYAGHKKVWDAHQSGVCSSMLCADTDDWDDYTQFASFSEDTYDNNRCSWSCGSKSVSTLKTALDNNQLILALMDGESSELTSATGTSWGIGDGSEYNLVEIPYAYAGNPVTNYSIYHPYNKKQVFTAAEFDTWYIGYGCILSCDKISDINPIPSGVQKFAYNTFTLQGTAYYETGGIYEPTIGCWDSNYDTSYEDTPNDTCYYEVNEADCTYCPNIIGDYSGTAINGNWDTSIIVQKNYSSTRNLAFTAVAVPITSSDTAVTFDESDITIQWIAPTLTSRIGYAKGAYDNDVNDDGKVLKTYIIGFNVSNSTSNGDNDYTKIWGSCWNVKYGGVSISTMCKTNYTNTTQGEYVSAVNWCSSVCPTYTFNNTYWGEIFNFTESYTGNFTLNVTVFTRNAHQTGYAGWESSAQINFSLTDSTLIPGFGDYVANITNLTDWNPAVTNPVLFNMNRTIFNEDYIEWIIVDPRGNGYDGEDYCIARGLSSEALAIADSAGALTGCTIPVNETTANKLQLYVLKVTPKIENGVLLTQKNRNYNVSVKIGTILNASYWVNHTYNFQSAVLNADVRLLSSNTSSWITYYGDTIWYDMNSTIKTEYPHEFFDISEVSVSIEACYDDSLWQTILSWLGLRKYCLVETPFDYRLWNNSPIIGVCYDYTDDGVYDKCFESQREDSENSWPWLNMSANCDSISCDASSKPEDQDWYLNASLGISSGTSILRGKICNLMNDCSTDTSAYTFIAPNYYSSCYFTEDEITHTSITFSNPNYHRAWSSSFTGINFTLNFANSSAANPFYSNRFKFISKSVYVVNPWHEILHSYDCYSADASVCADVCTAFPCNAQHGESWSSPISDVYFQGGQLAIFYFVTTGYDATRYGGTHCIINIGGPVIDGCIKGSSTDGDLDDNFKVFMNYTATNATIGFDPNCTVISNPNTSVSVNFSNATGGFDYNLTATTIYNVLSAAASSACWDGNNDGLWDAYSGYIACGYSPGESGGGIGYNLSSYCNTTVNIGSNWTAIYNITRNDTYNTTVKVSIFDKCGSSIANATKFAVWDRGVAPLLCFNGVRDNENGEFHTSGTASTSDYGGSCGTCTDGILNNDETQVNYHNSGFDYGGRWCGYCDNTLPNDNTWLMVINENGLSVPFDNFLCAEAEGADGAVSFFVIVIVIIIIIIIFLMIIVFIGPLLVISFKGVVFTVMFLIRMIRNARDIEFRRKLIRILKRKGRN